MNQKFAVRLTGLASTLVLLSGLSANVSAQQPYYPAQPGTMAPYQNQMPSQPYPMRSAPMPPRQSYNYPNRAPYNAPYNAPYRMPYGAPAPMNRPPVYNSPRPGNPYGNRPMYGNPRFGGTPYRGFNRGSRSPIPFESNFTPWSTRFWEEMGEGGENPFKDMEDWVDFKEPREGIANAWEDMINAPHEVGQMPGGWTAPSISVPNPVDVQKEFQETGKRVPDEMRTQMDNIEIQTW